MQQLTPSIDDLSQEYVLVQAWKKASAHIRYHNWFSDTLQLDLAAADLPRFIDKLSKKIRSGSYETDPLKLVPAPKSQHWRVNADGVWEPRKNGNTKIRPLAHVSLEDQVVATAVLLCLSERAETAQGDPRGNFKRAEIRKSLMSYGNRLFCDLDANNETLKHRWGSSKLYRAFFEDYRAFLQRPEAVAASISNHENILILQTDLSQFYDRVQPTQLYDCIRTLRAKGDDEGFYALVENLLNWSWDASSQKRFENYRMKADIPSFDGVALPQGLVPAGFFANLVMLDFDTAVLSKIGSNIAPGVTLHDACRYVDDVRLTISVPSDLNPETVQEATMSWLSNVLTEHCPGQKFSVEKTTTTSLDSSSVPLVQQSRKMERIQKAISSGFDATGGEEVIQALESLVRTQSNLTNSDTTYQLNAVRAVPDVKDETIGRFAAGRFRKTFRSLRPLLDERVFRNDEEYDETFKRRQLTRQDLDNEAHTFAITLVRKWIEDPSNVRLLRIALDLWPSRLLLEPVLKLIDPYLRGDIRNYDQRRIALYCLAEILKAGAVETGFVEDAECLPESIDITEYRNLLLSTARLVLSQKSFASPWYLKQQALLFVAVNDPKAIVRPRRSAKEAQYWQLIEFLNGTFEGLSDRDFALLAIVARRSFLSKKDIQELVRGAVTTKRHLEIAKRDLEFASELITDDTQVFSVHPAVQSDIGTASSDTSLAADSLHSLVMHGGQLNRLRNDIGVLSFAKRFLEFEGKNALPDVIPPSKVTIKTEATGNYDAVTSISMEPAAFSSKYKSIYSVPSWAKPEQRWRFQLGYLLRFILTAHVDFGLPVQRTSWRETQPIYRPTRAHWLQRQYGFYNGHEAFGDDWLPISQSTQDLLFSLLIWPGCRATSFQSHEMSLHEMKLTIDKALETAKEAIGPSTQTLMLREHAPIPGTAKNGRPLRACVVQSMMPQSNDFEPSDLEMLSSATRRKHRQHLSTALAAVEKMLDLRETHKPENKRLDWLIFPELAVHPIDVQSHLVPFARAFKTIILTGLTYEQLVEGQPLVNSALWVIPREIPGRGLQVMTRRQGKMNLSPMEQPFNSPNHKISGFRPAQWLVGYEWSDDDADDPLWLTASICYDATDLKLASDLRNRSDVFAIPALNQDVGTFDQMAQALHYHMYQLVLIANNGAFGGSNAHLPKGEAFHRKVFHSHGQPQATISFFEIDDISDMKDRWNQGEQKANGWKFPPAR
ncbi:RNA-directed DNA polymerase [uncultured Sulfitobacter sp.]|uniref:RNA-directed DNA polymerase n=1 Tax=uncultured Sulfitobacter sp. TaxID=191468 RepID=UPI00262DE2E1|nr:RNA-directed DNA polymerase [uncultured Sulfitobacter sp.]